MMATKKYRVKDGQAVKHGVEGGKVREHKAGAIVELEEEEAASMPWAVEPADKAAK
jgi:hypothetical protein